MVEHLTVRSLLSPADMASAKLPLSNEQFLCSICLEIFTEPVSTPCGHNYCKECIKAYWSVSEVSQCPMCKETFRGAPELRVNTEFRDMLEVFTRTFIPCDASSQAAEPGAVHCDLCHETKHTALKSCLVCLASYCNVHLQPHCTVQAFMWHKLVEPVANLQDRVCRKHNKMIEFFCRDDQSCVCAACLRDAHGKHNVVSVEEELKERRGRVKVIKKEVKQTLAVKHTVAEKIQKSVRKGQRDTDKMKAETVKALDALMASIESRKRRLIERLEEKQKAAEQQAEALVRQLQLEIVEIDHTMTKLEELLKTEDNFGLLRDLPSVPSTTSKHPLSARVRPLLSLETMRSAVGRMEETLGEEMDSVMEELDLVEEPVRNQTKRGFNDELGNIQRAFSVNVTLDPKTAHPSLIISANRRQVRDGGCKRNVPDNPTRFDFLHIVFGSEGFSSGRFYFEVSLKGQMGWEVGVARESISRKGCDLGLSPENGCWTLGSYWGRCQANASPPDMLSSSVKPEKLGVFVDYEEGLVSFYDVSARAVIYSFTECAFKKAVPHHKASAGPRVYTGTTARTKIYPLLRPGSDTGSSGPLQIIPLGSKKRRRDQAC